MLHTMYSSGHTYTSGTHKTQTRPQAFILTYTYYYTNIYYTHIEKHTNACINKDTKPTNTDTQTHEYTSTQTNGSLEYSSVSRLGALCSP